MPTPREAMARVAGVLADIDPQDRQAVSDFYLNRYPRYPKPAQELISGFLIGLTDLPTMKDLSNLKSAIGTQQHPDRKLASQLAVGKRKTHDPSAL